MAPRRPANSIAPITTSPRDILVDFQLRRENRALYDAMEELRAKATADLEAQRLRQEELERKVELAQQENQQLREDMKNNISEMSEQVHHLDEEIKRSEINVKGVVQQLSARMRPQSASFAADNAEEDDGSSALPSSPPRPTPAQRPPASPVQPQSAPFIPPHQRYALRRPGNARVAATVPGSVPTVVANQRENVGTRANMSRKKSMGASDIPVPETPMPTAATRARSNSSTSTLSTAPSTPSSPRRDEPEIPALPFNRKGTPHQGDMDIKVYFMAAAKFARDNRVNREPEDEQTIFILQIFKGMKKEERTELVGKLEEVSLAKMDKNRRTVTFLGLWDDIANAIDGEILAEVKAKVSLLRATAAMV